MERKIYHAEARERRFCTAVLLSSLLMANSFAASGMVLGFALGLTLIALSSTVYLISCGHKLGVYPGLMLIGSLVLTMGFARSDDYSMKMLMLLCLFITLNLTACLMTGQNLRPSGRFSTIWDAPRAFFSFGFSNIDAARTGLTAPVQGGKRKLTAGLIPGLLLAALVLAVVIPLLISADAAFEGLMAFLPELKLDLPELIFTLILGIFSFLVFYSQAVSLDREPKKAPKESHKVPTLNRLTVSIVLFAVCMVYAGFLVSQLAYLSGGFSGLLPQGFTPAEYARRGFFEMAWICAINLGLIIFAAAPVRQEGSGSLTRGLGLFIGAFSLFLVFSASARMNLYIHQFGLTRLRVLTEVFMLWLAITTAAVSLWLFLPKLPYMKAVILSALVLLGAVVWADVDSQVAKFNVDAYFAGELSTVDVDYLGELSSGAVPQIARLTKAADSEVADRAELILNRKALYYYDVLEDGLYTEVPKAAKHQRQDFRGWNSTYAQAYELLWSMANEGQFTRTMEQLNNDWYG